MSDEMEIRLITGHKIRLLPDELVGLAVHRNSIAIRAITVVLLVVLNFHPRVAEAPVWARLAVFFPAVMIWNILFVAALLFQAALCRVFHRPLIAYAPLANLIAVIGATTIGQSIGSYMGLPNPELAGWMMSVIMLNLFMAEFLNTIFYLTIAPPTLDDIRYGRAEDMVISSGTRPVPGRRLFWEVMHMIEDRTEPAANNQSERKTGNSPDALEIGGVKIAIDDIVRLSSQGGYTEIITKRHRYLECFPLQELAAMISEGVGYQVHRSHWVAFRGISSVRKEGRNRIITFDDGVEIPVARHRLAGFEKHQPPEVEVLANASTRPDED